MTGPSSTVLQEPYGNSFQTTMELVLRSQHAWLQPIIINRDLQLTYAC